MKRKYYFDLKITRIYFEKKSLVFVSETTKGHQGGKEHAELWHVYGNMFKPNNCPVIELKGYKPLGHRPNITQQ